MSVIKETYATAELVEVLQISQQALSRRASKEQWPTSEARQGRGGGYVYLYADLPADIKAVIARHLAAGQPKPSPGDMAIPEWSRQIGLARFQVVAAWRAFCQGGSGHGVGKTEQTAAFLLAYNSGQLATGAYKVIGQVQSL